MNWAGAPQGRVAERDTCAYCEPETITVDKSGANRAALRRIATQPVGAHHEMRSVQIVSTPHSASKRARAGSFTV
jgi:hypothetical protein